MRQTAFVQRFEWEIRHRADVRFLTESMQTRMEGEVSKIKAQATSAITPKDGVIGRQLVDS